MRVVVAMAVGVGIVGGVLASNGAKAQISVPEARPPDGSALFKQQCATCHSINNSNPPRQGPTLFNIVGRKAGRIEGFRYSSGFAQVDFAWSESKLDAWLTDPQAVIPGSIMAYRQAKPEIRAAIVGYLRGVR